MIGNLQGRLAALEESTPGGYRTYDASGEVLIDSQLPVLKWMLEAKTILRDGSPEQKSILRDRLARSVRSESGDRLFELVRVLAWGPIQ